MDLVLEAGLQLKTEHPGWQLLTAKSLLRNPARRAEGQQLTIPKRRHLRTPVELR
jgi:hypothetical protein